MTIPLGGGAEFDRIRAVWRAIGPRGSGLGDDAVLVTVGGESLALSADMAVEGQHFSLAWLAPAEIGYRAAAGALSDLAAVAAEPMGVLASVGVPPDRSEAFLVALMDGVAAAAASAGAVVWGGDLVRSDRVTVDIVVVGRAPDFVSRAGARAGERLWITGTLGGPAAALEAWREGREPAPAHRERFARPVPRVREARWLRERGATAAIDVSDGVAGDAGHLAAASGLRAVIEVERLPLLRGVTSWEVGVTSGEEFELLVTIPPDADPGMAPAFAAAFGTPLTCIGRMEQGDGVRLVRDGEPVSVAGGFSHF